MKSQLLLLLLLFVAYQGVSQISVSPKHTGMAEDFEDDELSQFKKTKTVFVLSNLFDEVDYDKIFKDSWTVTPYIVVKEENFNISDYQDGEYSIGRLNAQKAIVVKEKYKSEATYLFVNFDIQTYDYENIKKSLNKMNPKKKAAKIEGVYFDNIIDIARFSLYPKATFVNTIKTKKMDSVYRSLYSEDVLYNYNLGFIKNYLQKINNQLISEESYWMYKDDYLPELKRLSDDTLFIPSYVTIKTDAKTMIDSDEYNADILAILKNYTYKYKVIPTEDLDKKIMNNEEVYYLRFVRTNTERFIQIVNSKTGEIVYRDYIIGFSMNIKEKKIKLLNKTITKAKKK